MDKIDILHEGPPAAKFSERFVAFMIDLLVFVGGFYLSLAVFFPSTPVFRNPHSQKVLCVWAGLFILYHAFFSSDRRRTLGKRLLGIQVLSKEGGPLPFSKSLLRAAGYIPSSLFMCLGFIWALFHPRKKAWHDLIASSQAVETHTKGPLTRAAIVVSTGVFSILLAGTWAWQYILAPQYYDSAIVENTKACLQEVAKFQEMHFATFGTYAQSLEGLSRLTGDPKFFKFAVKQAVNPGYGLKIAVNEGGYTLTAKARDRNQTKITITGP